MATKQLAVSPKTARLLREVIAYIMEEPNRLVMDTFGQFFSDPSMKTSSVGLGHDENDNRRYVEQKIPPCRTMACIAGTCMLLDPASRKKFIEKYTMSNGKQLTRFFFPNDVEERATAALGITPNQARSLFFLKSWKNCLVDEQGSCLGEHHGYAGWPESFEEKYNKAKTARGRAKVAAARIEHFIATGE